MSDVPVTPSPDDRLLSMTRDNANRDLILYCDGLTTNTLAKWPVAEQMSWPFLQPQAEAVLAAGAATSLATAPLIAQICFYEFGEAPDDLTRIAQVRAKAPVLKGMADFLLDASAFVGGLRSRVQRMIFESDSALDIAGILSEAKMEIEQYRQANGL